MKDSTQDPSQTKRPTPPFKDETLSSPPGLEADMKTKPQFEGRAYRPAGKLEGRVALITGGDSGIGRSVAVLFAREGADVALFHLPEEREDAQKTIAHIEKAGRQGISIEGDVSDPKSCENAVKQCLDRFQKLNILVNNAAFQNHVKDVADLSIEQWDKTIKTNASGYFYMVKAALNHMQSGDCIINTGSINGLDGSAALLDYSASKGAISAFTKALAKNLAPQGIRVNCVAPGPVWTPLNPAERSEDEVESFGEGTPYGRPAQPDEISPAYVFFASNGDSSYITGETITLLGGEITSGS